MVMMSSEKTGDVIVENSFAMTLGRLSAELGLGAQAATWRDWRTLSGDRSRCSVHNQLKSVHEQMHNCLPAMSSFTSKRRVSKVFAHALNRTGAQLPLMRKSM